jgi:hypothetical protein
VCERESLNKLDRAEWLLLHAPLPLGEFESIREMLV